MEPDQKNKLLTYVQRSLALKHKIKVHDSMPRADTHEEISVNNVSRWELEDELRAIEELIAESRLKNVLAKKTEISKKGVKKKSPKFAEE